MTIFSKAKRTKMAMVFADGLVTAMDGIIPGTERKFFLYYYSAELFRDMPFFTGFISGIYGENFSGKTLDETLDKMEAYMERLMMEELLLGETLEMEVAVL